MKKLTKTLVILFIASLSLVSCNDDDENVFSGNLLGKWNYSKEGEIVNGQEVLTNYEHETGCAKDNVEFKSNGTFVNTDYFGDNCVEDQAEGTYTRNGNTIVASSYGESTTLTIKQLNSTMLKITYQDFDDESITNVEIYTRN